MFKTMSTNKDRPNGKFTGEASTKGKSSNWDFGVDDHEPAMTVTARDFAGFGDQKPEKRDKIPQPPVQVHMGDTPLSYISNSKAAFCPPPENFVKARPAKSKIESVKTNYSVSHHEGTCVVIW